MKKRTVPLVALFLALAFAAQAQGGPAVPDLVSDFGEDSLGLVLGASATADADYGFYTEEKGGVTYVSPNFAFAALLGFDGDGRYYKGLNIGDNYFMADAGGVALTFGDFSARAGQLPMRDAVDSPYSLFVNGEGKTAMLGEFRFSRGAFSYESRWIGLNHHSAVKTTAFPSGFPERGANLKTYSLDLGAVTIGIEDLSVYSGRYFDFSYFIDPMPGYFVQYVSSRAGRPWYNGYEDNNILGFYGTWQASEDIDAYAQFLLDDFSVLGLLGTWSNNPWKAAWSLGGSWRTASGTFGFYHAGATKYCFEPTYETIGREYGYTYYPDTVYDSSNSAIPFEDMMVGYSHGENNLAFMATWSHVMAGFGLRAALEFTLSGAKSPANAWHEETWTDYEGTRLLDDAVLEKKVLLSFGASRSFGVFDLFLLGRVGYVFNELELVGIPAQVTVSNGTTHATQTYSDIWIWTPSDTNRLLYSITIGGRVRLELLK